MSRRLEQMRGNPRGDWTIRDVETVYREIGIACEPPRAGGSHYKIWHSVSVQILTIPSRRPIKPVYIRKLVAFIDDVTAVR